MTCDDQRVREIRSRFPIFSHEPLIYLDSAATALKPDCVIEAVTQVLQFKTGNPHRSVHHLGDRATETLEAARKTVANFINAEANEIIFVRNTTEAINLVAHSFASSRALVSLGNHHSNLLPWKNVHRLLPTADGSFNMRQLEDELKKEKGGIVSASHVCNVTGSQVDATQLAQLCHENDALLMLDVAQSIAHQPIDVCDLDCDFLAFSAHKMGGPTGIGVLFGKSSLLDRMPPFLLGGQTVDEVHEYDHVLKDVPWRFEAGTPPVEAAAGLAAAVQFLEEDIGLDWSQEHQAQLVKHALARIVEDLPEMQVLGTPATNRLGPISLIQRLVNPHQLARSLSDGQRICVRSGFHCAQPLHEFLKVPASLRLSFSYYNSTEEIDLTVHALKQLVRLAK